MSGHPSAMPGPDPAALAALMARVARGDEAAFAVVYDAISPLAFGVIRRVLRDPSQSEEVVQEVMVEVWRTATRFDPDRGSVSTWVATMAHRRAVDRVRSEQSSRRRTEQDQHGAALVAPDVGDDVTESLHREAEREARPERSPASPTPNASRSSWPTTAATPTPRWHDCWTSPSAP
ncbi:MAG: sigma-70 family RNA polymerase sigma factor [Acidimicrobiales bacterium]